MKLRDLPNGYPVSLDTETSGLHVDDNARLAAVSFAYRVPNEDGLSVESGEMVHRAYAFDQGIENLPLGDKELDDKIIRRLSKWPDWALDESAGNLPVEEFQRLCAELSRMNLVFHNAKFDMHIFRAGLRGRPDTAINFEDSCVWDTQLTQSVLDPRFPTGLKPTSVRLHLGAAMGVKEGMEDDEAEALKPWLGPRTGKNADPRYDLVPWSIMGPYAGMDAALTLLLWEHQCRLLHEEQQFQMKHVDTELSLMKVLYRMETRGMGFDLNTAFRMEQLIEKTRLEVAAMLPFDPTPNKARAYFFGDAPEGLEHIKFSDKLTEKRGDPQVDDEVISRLAAEEWEGQDTAKIYQRHEALKSANSKWYGSWPYMAGLDGRLRTNHRQATVVSGRLAVERFQAQAIVHDYQLKALGVDELVSVRNLFIETEVCSCGCGELELYEFDISQAEIRIATAAAQCRPMLEGFARGDDSHSIATRLMFGDKFADDGFAGNEESHPDWDEYRQVAKRCNLGILYGAGVKVIIEQIKKFTGREYKARQVSKWISTWNAAFPQMGDRLHLLERVAINRGWVKLVNGRQAWFSPYDQLHKAFNREIQGSLAETMKVVMILVENEFPNALLLQIHDSLVTRLSRCQIAKGAKERISAIMVDTFEEAFTFRWKDSGKLVRVPFRSDDKRFGRYDK